MLIRRVIGTLLVVAVIAVVTAVHVLAKRGHATGVFVCLNDEAVRKVHLTFGHHACFGGDETSLDFVLTRGWQPNEPKSAEVRTDGDAGHGLVSMDYDDASTELLVDPLPMCGDPHRCGADPIRVGLSIYKMNRCERCIDYKERHDDHGPAVAEHRHLGGVVRIVKHLTDRVPRWAVTVLL